MSSTVNPQITIRPPQEGDIATLPAALESEAPPYQDRDTLVAGPVQHEVGVGAPIGQKPPVEEEELANARPLDALEELLGYDLVGVNVDPVERRAPRPSA